MVRLRNGQSFPKKEEEEPTAPPPPPPRKKASKRASSGVDDVKPAKVPSPPPPAAGKRKRASKKATNTGVDDDVKPATTKLPPAVPAGKRKAAPRARAEPNKRAAEGRENVTVEDTDAFNCGICFLPLKPPIFQCEVGHVVCSQCRNKLKNPGKCHVCGGATGGFRRCHAMERVVEAIHVPCPNSSHGCNAKPPYHGQQGHQQKCMMLSQFHCPDKACRFVGSMDTLLAHFAGKHRWPCTTTVRETKYERCTVVLRNGFNFLRTNTPITTTTPATQFLFLLNLARLPDGAAAISVLCIQSRAAMSQRPTLKDLKCDLSYSRYQWHSRPVGDLLQHNPSSVFKVACTDFSEGLPNLNDRFQFVVSNSALRVQDARMNTMEIGFSFELD